MSSIEILKSNADRSQQCATLFLKFKDYLPASSEGAVTSVVTDLFAVSRALLELRDSIDEPRNDNYLDLIDKERDIVSRSITLTLRDVQKHTNLVEELQESRQLGSSRVREAYELTWNKIKHHFADEGAKITDCTTLTARLETYVHFLKDVKAKLEGDTPSRHFAAMRSRLDRLLQKQEKNFEVSIGLGRLSLGPEIPAFKKEKSWERTRPEKDLDRDQDRRPRYEHVRRDEPRSARRPARRSEEERPQRSFSRTRPGKARCDSDFTDSSYDHLDSDGRNSSELGSPIGYDWDDDDEHPDIMSPLANHYYRQPQSQRPGMFPHRPSFSSGAGVTAGAPSMGYFVPRPPDPPGAGATFGFKSPVSSSATATSSTVGSETTSSSADSHWLPIAFNLSRPSTPFHTSISASESGCYGDHEPSALSNLNQTGFDKLMKLPFEEPSGLTLYIYVRDEDRRAKLLVRQGRSSSRTPLMACDAVSNLRILRNEACLQLCQTAEDEGRDKGKGKGKARRDDRAGKDRDRPKVYLWTSLHFPSYERMVIFWCSFNALKMQDEYAKLAHLDDATLDGERCLFSAIIEDDNYEHALHLLRDRDSRGLRLQASVLKGDMKRTPVWTAFITYQVASSQWARLAGGGRAGKGRENVVGLKELTRFVFMDADGYTPRVSGRGEQEVRFRDEGRAREFLAVLRDCAAGKV